MGLHKNMVAEGHQRSKHAPRKTNVTFHIWASQNLHTHTLVMFMLAVLRLAASRLMFKLVALGLFLDPREAQPRALLPRWRSRRRGC